MSIIWIGDVNYITAWVTRVSLLGEYACLTHRGSNVAKLMSHVTRMIGSHTWMNCVTHMDGLCCTYCGVMPHIMDEYCSMDGSSHTQRGVVSQIYSSHVEHTLSNTGVMAHVWMVPYNLWHDLSLQIVIWKIFARFRNFFFHTSKNVTIFLELGTNVTISSHCHINLQICGMTCLWFGKYQKRCVDVSKETCTHVKRDWQIKRDL